MELMQSLGVGLLVVVELGGGGAAAIRVEESGNGGIR